MITPEAFSKSMWPHLWKLTKIFQYSSNIYPRRQWLNNKHWDILICPIPIYWLNGSLENQQPVNYSTHENQQPSSHWKGWGRPGWELLPKRLICTALWWSDSSWTHSHIHRAGLYFTWLKACFPETAFS